MEVDVTKCHACHARHPGVTDDVSKCYACRAKDSDVTGDQRGPSVSPDQPSAISAMPATQKHV